MKFVLATVFALLALSVVRIAKADDPALEYYTYETPHFRVTYSEPLDALARRVAIVSESLYARLVREMAFTPDEKTEIFLTDDSEAANGSAIPVPYNAIRLYATAPGDISALGDYDDWMLALITHEYTHILHTGNISGLSAIANRLIGKTLSPNSAQPRWIIEGLAVVEESEYTTGGRVRSSLFDMFIRTDVLEDNFARLDQISSNPWRYPGGNLFYLYGSRFLRWIVDIYGPDTMTAVSADYGATTVPFGINRAIRRVTGMTYEELYDGWHASLRETYRAQIAEVDRRGRREGKRITTHGRVATYPRFVPPAARKHPGPAHEILYSRSNGFDITGLYGLSLAADLSPGDAELWARVSSDGNATFTPEGDLMFAAVEAYRDLYRRGDLFRVRRGETFESGDENTRERLTHGMRTSDPDVSPDGRLITFVTNSRSTTFLRLADLTAEGKITNVRTLVPSKAYEQAYTPRFSPDGSKIAYSVWTEGGYRDIRIVDVATGIFENVTRDRTLDMQPVWSPDGERLYFSSDRNGIFNIYVMELATRALSQVTNVATGALTPAVSADEKTLVYAGYTHEGYDLFAMKLDPKQYLAPPPPPKDRPPLLPELADVPIEKKAYNPLVTFAPKQYWLRFAPGNYGPLAVTVTMNAGDIVGHHALSAAVTVEGNAPGPQLSLGYSYGGLPMALGVSVSKAVVPRKNGYRIADRVLPFDEQQTTFSTNVGYGIHSSYVEHGFDFGYSATLYHAELPAPTELDPWSTTTVKPDEGFLSQFRGSYSLSVFDGSTEAPGGTARGISFRLGASYAGPETGSTAQYYAFSTSVAGFVPLPWLYHVLALRLAGGIGGGDYARRGVFYTGGYDTTRVNFIDSILDGTYNGAFVLRGYAPGEFGGSEYLLSSLEYRLPIVKADWGPSSLPIFLSRIDGAAFFDYGGAFDDLQIEETRFFKDGDLLYQPNLHASVGAEVWFALTLAHRIDTMLRLGYAYGFSSAALEFGQVYFLAASAF